MLRVRYGVRVAHSTRWTAGDYKPAIRCIPDSQAQANSLELIGLGDWLVLSAQPTRGQAERIAHKSAITLGAHARLYLATERRGSALPVESN